MNDLERTFPRFVSRPCRKTPTRLHVLYRHALDAVCLFFVAVAIWSFVTVFLLGAS